MGILYASVLNEIEKILLRRRNIIFLIITAVCTLLLSIGVMFFQSKFGFVVVTGSAFPVYTLGYFVKVFLPLFVFMTGADAFTGEASEKTLKLSLTKAISRTKIFVSKNIALIIFAVINLFIVFIISFFAGLFFSVRGDIVVGFLRSLGLYFIDVLPVAAMVLLTSFFAQLFKSSSSTITTCILIYLGFYILSMVIPIISSISITNLNNWHLLWVGSNFPFMEFMNKLVQIIAYIITFFALGAYMFDRKEV